MWTEFVASLGWTWALSANVGAALNGALACGLVLFVLGGFADPWVSVVLLRNDASGCATTLMSQFAGGVAGAALALASGSSARPNAVPVGTTAVQAFAAEAVGAAVKMFAAGKGASQHAAASSAVALVLLPLTSYSGGAARVLGLAAVHGAFGRECWVFLAGPLVGTLVGALAGGLDDALRRRGVRGPEPEPDEDDDDDELVVRKRIESDKTCSSRCKLPYSSEFSGDSAAEAGHFAAAEARFGSSLKKELDRQLSDVPTLPA